MADDVSLGGWLRANGYSAASFARKIGVPPSTIYRILDDGRSPAHAVMEKIIKGTNGAVLPNSFFDLEKAG